MLFRVINDENVISAIFRMAGYTYGPLLGLYTVGIFTKWQVNGKLIPFISVIAPVICYFLNKYSEQLLNGYQIGFELLIINGFITFVLLFFSRVKK
jgi:hypothetical protein